MPENRQPKRNGAVSNPAVDNIEEAIRRLKIQTNDKQDVGALVQYCPYPDRPGEPDCIYYLRTGMCGYGSNCRFNHPSYLGQVGQLGGEFPERIGQPDCEYFLKTGTCKYGSTCKYNHPRDRHGAGPVLLNILGLPIRQDEKSCSYYMRTGTCKYGIACKFDHPQPSSTGTVSTVPGPTSAYGATGLTIVPSTDLAYTAGPPAWSLARATTYFSGARSQGTQTYMPLVYSPSQGLSPPPQGWNTYMGSMSPAAATNLIGEAGAFNGHMMHSLSNNINHNISVSNLPERPDQPECRYFMSTGSCKFGLNCKYHHPREKTAQFATNSMGPLGLPLRPGQAVCSYYNMYGLCKYGPTCKFDHPVLGYSYNYGVNLPTLSVLDPSTFSYHQKSSSTAHLSEISPSKSSKFTDWNRKRGGGAAAIKKNSKPDTKTAENSPKQVASPPDSPARPDDQSE